MAVELSQGNKWAKYMETSTEEVNLGDESNGRVNTDVESSAAREPSSFKKRKSKKEKVDNEGTCGWLLGLFDDQDFMQKVNVGVKILLELYRVIIASFLILFVPQECPHPRPHLCSIEENAELGLYSLYDAGFSLNCITLIAFVLMYVAEYRRESKLIDYLDVNSNLKFDNDSVKAQLAKLPKEQWEEILFADTWYKYTGSFALLCFVTNVILSGVVISDYYMGDKTAVNFITSVLFMISKLNVVRATIKTDTYVLPSAYLTVQMQFNDVEHAEI